MFENLCRAKNVDTSEIKFFESLRGRQKFLLANPNWKGVGR